MRLSLLCFVLSSGLACQEPTYVVLPPLSPQVGLDASVAQALPLPPVLDMQRVSLGERLFSDTLLSVDGKVSCASCHPLQAGGVDHRRRAVGVHGAVGSFNTPTVFNASLQFRQFWDGRVGTLEEQVERPLLAPKEMGSCWEDILSALQRDASYPALFASSYSDGITKENVRDAIATFERSLITPDAPFDHFLRGDHSALSEEARRGYRMFMEYGCASCHQGVLLGGNMYQRFGVISAPKERSGVDLGRYLVTGREEDRFVFKVPSLRNIERTAPYFHDGSAEALQDAVLLMGRYQLGRELQEDEIRLLVAFLRSLTGEYHGRSL